MTLQLQRVERSLDPRGYPTGYDASCLQAAAGWIDPQPDPLDSSRQLGWSA